MHRPSPLVLAAVLVSACSTMATAYDMSPPAMPSALAGCWQHVNGDTREYWTDTGTGLMFGHSLTISDGELRAFEDMRVQPTADGFAFFASPNGAAPVRFDAVTVTKTAIQFENADHDFPQVIAYARSGDTLVATISAIGGENAMDFTMRACPAE